MDAGVGPEREEARAVAEGEQLVKLRFDCGPWQSVEDGLPQLERRYDVERQARHEPERAEPDHGCVEVVVAAFEVHELAVGPYEVECADGRGERSVARA